MMTVSVERLMIDVERFHTNAAVDKNKVFAEKVAARKKICAWCCHYVVVGDPAIDLTSCDSGNSCYQACYSDEKKPPIMYAVFL
jgi:hypothetical protein